MVFNKKMLISSIILLAFSAESNNGQLYITQNVAFSSVNFFLAGLICGYHIFSSKKKNDDVIPFAVSVVNKRTGEANILLKADHLLTVCQNESEYEYLISAVDCGSYTDGYGNYFKQRSSHK